MPGYGTCRQQTMVSLVLFNSYKCTLKFHKKKKEKIYTIQSQKKSKVFFYNQTIFFSRIFFIYWAIYLVSLKSAFWSNSHYGYRVRGRFKSAPSPLLSVKCRELFVLIVQCTLVINRAEGMHSNGQLQLFWK